VPRAPTVLEQARDQRACRWLTQLTEGGFVTQRARWSEEQGTAFHEAGHAVVMFLENGPFKKVSIGREDGSLG